MKENIQAEYVFSKDRADMEMMRNALKSPEIDQKIIPIIEKFFSLPMSPNESCYGHVKEFKDPYLSYVHDKVEKEEDVKLQELFQEKLEKLEKTINKRAGSVVVDIDLNEIDHGGGPKEFELRFKIIDKKVFQELGEKLLEIIWEEFSRYLDKIRY